MGPLDCPLCARGGRFRLRRRRRSPGHLSRAGHGGHRRSIGPRQRLLAERARDRAEVRRYDFLTAGRANEWTRRGIRRSEAHGNPLSPSRVCVEECRSAFSLYENAERGTNNERSHSHQPFVARKVDRRTLRRAILSSICQLARSSHRRAGRTVKTRVAQASASSSARATRRSSARG